MDCAYKRCVNQGACEIFKRSAPVRKRGRVAAACWQHPTKGCKKPLAASCLQRVKLAESVMI